MKTEPTSTLKIVISSWIAILNSINLVSTLATGSSD
jgi:hypothetical protein